LLYNVALSAQVTNDDKAIWEILATDFKSKSFSLTLLETVNIQSQNCRTETWKVNKNNKEMLTVSGKVCNQVWFYREDINVCDIWIWILALQFGTESV